MNRKQVAELLPILKAFSEGKEIEAIYKRTKSPWFKVEEMFFDKGTIFRIKPEHTYRPFKDAAECWAEMQKHQRFGWVKDRNRSKFAIGAVDTDDTVFVCGYGTRTFDEVFEYYTFADGTPFGVKMEEQL